MNYPLVVLDAHCNATLAICFASFNEICLNSLINVWYKCLYGAITFVFLNKDPFTIISSLLESNSICRSSTSFNCSVSSGKLINCSWINSIFDSNNSNVKFFSLNKISPSFLLAFFTYCTGNWILPNCSTIDRISCIDFAWHILNLKASDLTTWRYDSLGTLYFCKYF